MARTKAKPTLQKATEPRQVSPELRSSMDHFVRSIRHMVLVKVNPEAARDMAEEPA